MELFNEIKNKIEQEYTLLRLKNKNINDGWRFLYCPKERLEDNNGILILGLNPGSGYEPGDKVSPDSDTNVYLDANLWTGNQKRIQKNIELLFKKIAEIKYKDENHWKKLIEQSLASNYIFFRTKDSESLNEEIAKFSKKIWEKIIKKNNFKIMICIGTDPTYDIIQDIINRENKIEEKYNFKWGGGSVKYSGYEKIILVGFYHFSYSPDIDNNDYKKDIDETCKLISGYINK